MKEDKKQKRCILGLKIALLGMDKFQKSLNVSALSNVIPL